MCSGLLSVLLLCNNRSFVNRNAKRIYYRRLDVFRFVVNLSVRNFRSIYGLSALAGSGNKCNMSSVTLQFLTMRYEDVTYIQRRIASGNNTFSVFSHG